MADKTETQAAAPAPASTTHAEASRARKKEQFREYQREQAEKMLLEGPRKWQVQLPSNPLKIVGANSAPDAVEKYKQYCGITATIHQPSVTDVTEQWPATDAKPAKGESKPEPKKTDPKPAK